MEITLNQSAPQKLYLLQLAVMTVPRADGSMMKMSMGCYLVESTDNRRILIDSGIAPAARAANTLPARSETTVIEQLTELGLRPCDINTVICTHFDVDHAGYHDHFPQAEFIVQRSHYELARSGSPRLAKARRHWDHPSLRYRLIDGDIELMPGLELIETSGHVTGHQSVLVRLPRTGSVLLAVDAVMMGSLFTPDRRASPFDENEEQLRASTQKLAAIASREPAALVVFGHDGVQWQSLKKAPGFYD
jgi:N-acyl homoserine lactone hydrolase